MNTYSHEQQYQGADTAQVQEQLPAEIPVSNSAVAFEAAKVRAERAANAGGASSSDSSNSERPLVRVGSTGSAVTILQNMLLGQGNQLAVDGVFGPQTHQAVTQFQSANGLMVDGVVGPQTWGVMESQQTQAAPPGLDFAIGDAEGNGELDQPQPVAGEQQTTETTSLVDAGGAQAKSLTGDPVIADNAKPGVDHAEKGALLAGGFADRGDYRASGDGFTDGDLDQLLAAYGAFWGIDVRATPQPDDPKQAPGAGDSAGKGVHLHPPWVKAMQNAIIGRPKWNDDDRATQKLLESFLRAWTREMNEAVPEGLPPGAEQMFHQIGASETNNEAGSLGGFKGAGNWCGQASSTALIVGMYNRGIRFKGGTPSKKFFPELARQISRFSEWVKSGGQAVGGKTAWTAPVEPGDIISVVNGGHQGPLSGHVATVVGEEGDKIFYVSGNAAGVHGFEGAVRVEEVTREVPPANYDWLTVGGRGNDYAELGQTASAQNKAADATHAEIDAKTAFIFANLPAELATVTDLNVLLTKLLSSPTAVLGKSALIGNIREVLELQAKATGHRSAALAAQAKRKGMETDNTGLPVSRSDLRFRNNPGKFAPIDPTSSWVVSIIKSSGLTKAAMLGNKQVGLVPTDPALEVGPTLAEQCPDAPPELINNS